MPQKRLSVAWSYINDVWFSNNLSSAERSCIKSLGIGYNFIIHNYIIISFPLGACQVRPFLRRVITSTVLLPGLSSMLGIATFAVPLARLLEHQIQGSSVFKGR